MASTRLARRLVEAEARALVVFAKEEAPKARDRVRIIASPNVVADLATELPHSGESGIEVVDPEE